jgi:phage gp16-like protein
MSASTTRSKQPSTRGRLGGMRKADLAAIHIAKAALGWSDDEYRDIMATVCGGVRSSGNLDMAGRKRFLAHLQACQRANGRTAAKPAPRPPEADLTPQQAKIWALWQQLADAGLVRDRSRGALNSYCRRICQVDQWIWLQPLQQDLVIDTLRKWLDRGPGDNRAT